MPQLHAGCRLSKAQRQLYSADDFQGCHLSNMAVRPHPQNYFASKKHQFISSQENAYLLYVSVSFAAFLKQIKDIPLL
jgi:hypothetical protein